MKDNDDKQEHENRKLINKTRQNQQIILISLILLFLCYTLLKPREIGFYCDDIPSLSKPFKNDIMPNWLLVLIGLTANILVIMFIETEILRKYYLISLFLAGLSLVLLFTEFGKKSISRLRPHFLKVCKPTSYNCTVFKLIETSRDFCYGNSKQIKEARLSFPSGHSSFSCYTMLFLILYIQIKLKNQFAKCLIQVLALSFAVGTCLSRIYDNHHHLTDVACGSLLGFVIAIIINCQIRRFLDYPAQNLEVY